MTTNIGLPGVDISKLTVPQLKALCKERKITGYSKLGKQALLQKLAPCGSFAVPPAGPSPSVVVSSATSEQPALQDNHDSATASCAKKPHATVRSTELPKSYIPATKAFKAKKAKPVTQNENAALVSINLGTSPNILLDGGSSIHLGDTSKCVHSSNPDLSVSSHPVDKLAGFPVAFSQPHQGETHMTAARVIVASDSIGTRGNLPSTGDSPAQMRTAAPASKKAASLRNTLLSKRPLQDSSTTSSPKKQKIQSSRMSITSSKVLGVNPARPASGFKVPSLLRDQSEAIYRHPRSNSSNTSALHTSGNPTAFVLDSATTVNNHLQSFSLPSSGKRFKPLVIEKSAAHKPALQPGKYTNTPHIATPQAPIAALHYLDLPLGSPIPELSSITLPPSLAQRKRVHRWAVILSGLSDRERRICVLVSRMFRYAIYLSASHRLSNGFSGRRFTQDIIERYPQAMTNMWPYLRLREAEALHWRQVYEESFLANFFRVTSLPNPIANHLWTSPDDERQIIIALRFVVSRVWFELSLGVSNGAKDATSWLCGTITDAQEAVKNEVWRITVVYPSMLSSERGIEREVFYVLESTCEVVGRSLSRLHGQGLDDIQHGVVSVRADWSAYISRHLLPSSDASPIPLLAHLKWANREEYENGISRLWLKRVAVESTLGVAKRAIAERYVLACVVGNSVSGQWMHATEMAQEFAGLASRVGYARPRTKESSINLYLPEHHHVESLHFTTANGQLLHPALAAVQTPHREYYILRDNGMQVGCEEEGIATVWQRVLKCDCRGMPL